MNKRKWSALELVLFILPLGVFAFFWVLNSDVFHPVEKGRRNICQANLKSMALALKLYTNEYNSFPLAVVAGVNGRTVTTFSPNPPMGWADAVAPLIKNTTMFQCPSEGAGQSAPGFKGWSDYWYNGNLSGAPQKSLAFPNKTLSVGEGNDGRDLNDATYNKTSFGSWPSDTGSPMYRHLSGANYLFVDGHIKWLKPNAVQNFGGRADPFALR